MQATSEANFNKIQTEATDAMNAKDWERAAVCWQQLRELGETKVIGYERGLKALSHLKRFDEMEALAKSAVQRFPMNAAIAALWGDVAIARQDWQQALVRWGEFHQHFKATPHSCIQENIALTHSGKSEEAERLLVESGLQWPQHKLIAINLAELATCNQDWLTALVRWESVRRLSPNSIPAYKRSVLVLENLGRLEEAKALLREAVQRFPKNITFASQLKKLEQQNKSENSKQWPAFLEEVSSVLGQDIAEKLAMIASLRQDWLAASERWSYVRQRFGGSTHGYRYETSALIHLGKLKEAQLLLAEATQFWPRDKGLAAQYARVNAFDFLNHHIINWLQLMTKSVDSK